MKSIDLLYDNNNLAQLEFVYVTDTYVDESSLAARTFNKQYLEKNKALPSYYATRGFDVTYDVVMRLASGKNFMILLKKVFLIELKVSSIIIKEPLVFQKIMDCFC